MLTWSRALAHVAACYGDDRPAPLALMAACPAARAAVEYSAAGAVMACDGVVVQRRRDACVPDVPVYMQSHTCELTVDRWDRHSTAAVTAALWWLLRAPPAGAASALQPRLALYVRAMHDGDALPRADDDDDGPARPLDARVRGVRVQTRWRDVYARLCAVRVLHSDGGVDVSALRNAAAELTVLQLCGTAATAALDWLPQCTQLQELTLQCSERCADVGSRSIDLSALTQLRTCTLFIDGRICVDLRGCRALRDVHVCRYYIVDNDVSSVDACTTLMLYRKSDDDVLRELATTAYTTINNFYLLYISKQQFFDDDYYAQMPERSVLVLTSVACDLHWLARYTQLETVCIRHTRHDTQHNGDYSALAALPQLRELEFQVPCVDLRTLAQCARLEELVLFEARCIGDFSALASAPQLRKVSLVKPTHALLRSLQHCTQLGELNVDGADADNTYTCDKEMLAKLRHLRSVKLDRASSDVVDMVSGCQHIEVMTLQDIYTTNYGFLGGMPRLRELKIDTKRCDHFSWIMGLTYLETLEVNIEKDTIEYYVPYGLPELRELCLNAVNEEHIKYIALSTQLVSLHLYSGDVDCTPLRALTQLRELHLSVHELYNINALSHCTQLVSLSIECHKLLCDIPCLDALTQLRTLRIQHGGVSDLLWIANCTQLHTLSVTLSAIGSEYSPLGALTQLRELTIVRYGTIDISWIAHCTQLEVLDLRYSNVMPHDALAALPRLRVLTLCWSTRADLGWLARCTQLEKVTFRPHIYNTLQAPLAQLRELGLCDIGEADYKDKRSVTLRRNKAQARATHSGTAPVHYRFTYTTR